MRIIVLNDHGNINGGAAQVAIASVNGLSAAGMDVTFVSSVGPVDLSIDKSLVKIVNFELNDLMGDPSRLHAALSGLWNQQSEVRFAVLLDNFDPYDTVIHLHTWMKSLSSSVVREAVRRGFRIVCTLHDYFSICPNGGLYNFQQHKLCELVPMSLSCMASNCDARSYGQKVWRVARQVVQNKFGHIPEGIFCFISVSDYSESILRTWLPASARFYRVRNPIDIGKFSLSKVNDNSPFTFIGRLSPEKGAVLFATAARLAGVKAVFVGCGEEEVSIRVENPDAELLGWQDRAGVIRAIQSSRALVFPSLLHETQGMVVLEAAALGVPAIVPDACAASDAIIDGETGLLFRTGDQNDLAEKIMLLKNDAVLSARMGLNAYERYWNAPCSIENHVKELTVCYTKILQARS